MDANYRRWERTEERRERTARAGGTPRHEREPHPLLTAVVAPVLQALAVGVCAALLVGGLTALFGTPLALAAKLATAGLLVGTGGTGLLFVFQERQVRIAPMRQAWHRLALAEPTPPPEPDDAEPWRVIRPYGGRREPAMLTATVNAEAQTLEPDVRPAIRQLYQFICDSWDGGTGNLSRAACRKRGYTRAVWERLVAGVRGKSGESARGILDRGGVVEMDADGWRWRDGVTLADVFSITDELREYSEKRAALVTNRRDRTDGTGQDAPVRDAGRPGTR